MSNNAPFSDHIPGSAPEGDDVPYAWIDEWLCEYVDGTMDPALEAVFTSYVEANPELKAHIEELQQTRKLLKQFRLSDTSPTDQAQTEVCDQVESDLLRSKLSLREAFSNRSQLTTGLFISVIAALMFGVVVGATVVGGPSIPGGASPEITASERTSAPDRPALPSAMLPPLGAQSESSAMSASRMGTAMPAAAHWHIPSMALDSLQHRSALGVIRTQR